MFIARHYAKRRKKIEKESFFLLLYTHEKKEANKISNNKTTKPIYSNDIKSKKTTKKQDAIIYFYIMLETLIYIVYWMLDDLIEWPSLSLSRSLAHLLSKLDFVKFRFAYTTTIMCVGTVNCGIRKSRAGVRSCSVSIRIIQFCMACD